LLASPCSVGFLSIPDVSTGDPAVAGVHGSACGPFFADISAIALEDSQIQCRLNRISPYY
jgi:hypothetical protein